MPITKSTDAAIVQRTNLYAAADMLAHAKPVEVLQKMARVVPMPLNSSMTIRFRRRVPFTAKTTPLAEGVTPDATSMAYEDVSATLRQYGDQSVITDVIHDTHEDAVIKDATMMHGENIGRTKEALLYGVIRGGTTVSYANGSSRNAVNTVITLDLQRRVTRYLRAQKAMKITKILDATMNISTRYVEAAYVAFAHTDCDRDIRGLSGFLPVAAYGTKSVICPEEIGSVEDVRYVLSADLAPFADAGGAKGTMVSTTGTSADVYPVIFVGQDAYATVVLRGKDAINASVIMPGVKTKDDPLGQRGVVAWIMYHAALRLNETWMARLEVAVTAL